MKRSEIGEEAEPPPTRPAVSAFAYILDNLEALFRKVPPPACSSGGRV